MIRAIPWFMVPYIEREEGEKFHAYLDSRGRPTIGVGHTGPEVRMGLVWVQSQVDSALRLDMLTAASRLVDAIGQPAIDRMFIHQYGALLSFVFNAGEVSSWTIWADIRAGNNADVPNQLKRFIYSNGKVIPGLVNRRKSDVDLWNGTDPVLKLAPPQPAV